nr:hypothetical protein [Tanacetum cinerariifolium]
MIAILEKYEHNVNFHQIVDFVEASYISPKSTGFNEFSSNIATAVGEGLGTPTEPHHTPSFEAQQSPHNAPSSPSQPTGTTKIIPTVTPTEIPKLRQYSKRARIAQSKALPTAADEHASLSRDDSQGEAFLTEEAGVEKSTERGSNDTEELVNVLTSIDAANILTSEVQAVSVPPVTEIPIVGIPTGSDLVPTASPIFTTASVVTPYSRCKGKEKMIESDTPKKKKLQKEIDVHVAREMEEQMAREDQRRNEQIARDAKIARIHAEEELQMLIDGLDISKRMKKKGLRLEQESTKKIKSSEGVSEEDLKEMMQLVPVEEVYVEALQVKHPIIDWEIHSEGQRNYWKIIRLRGHTAVYQFFVDLLKHFDREDLIQLWTLVKETISIRQATCDKEKELWVELKRLFEPDF